MNATRNLQTFPKIELHAHLSGSLSNECLEKLIAQADLPQNQKEKLIQPLVKKKISERSLNECFEIFNIIHTLTTKLDSVKCMTEFVIKEFAEDNVKYLELRTTPKCVQGEYSKYQYIHTVLDTIIESSNEENIMVRLLLSIDRSRGVKDAEDTLKVMKTICDDVKYKKYLVGLDVSGNPHSGTLKDYIHILKEAKLANIKITVHLCEIKSEIAFEEAFELINLNLVDRIGHGTFIHPKMGGTADLYRTIRAKNIPFEVCLTSNVLSGTIERIENHHVKYLKEEGLPFVICTDDKGVFGTTLTRETEIFCEVFDGSQDDLLKMANLAVNVTFLPEEDKSILRINIEKILASVHYAKVL